MKFIPRQLRTENYVMQSQKSVSDFKADLQSLFNNKWNDFSINLAGEFKNDNEFVITKKYSSFFSSSVSGSVTRLKCKVYTKNDKTIIDVRVKPGSQVFAWTVLPPVMGVYFLLTLLYSYKPTHDRVAPVSISIVLLFVFPVILRFYGQIAKDELKTTFIDTFKLISTDRI